MGCKVTSSMEDTVIGLFQSITYRSVPCCDKYGTWTFEEGSFVLREKWVVDYFRSYGSDIESEWLLDITCV